jgi:hypothetical protein
MNTTQNKTSQGHWKGTGVVICEGLKKNIRLGFECTQEPQRRCGRLGVLDGEVAGSYGLNSSCSNPKCTGV